MRPCSSGLFAKGCNVVAETVAILYTWTTRRRQLSYCRQSQPEINGMWLTHDGLDIITDFVTISYPHIFASVICILNSIIEKLQKHRSDTHINILNIRDDTLSRQTNNRKIQGSVITNICIVNPRPANICTQIYQHTFLDWWCYYIFQYQ